MDKVAILEVMVWELEQKLARMLRRNCQTRDEQIFRIPAGKLPRFRKFQL